MGFRFITRAGFSYWPRQHSEAHAGLMFTFCSSWGPFPPVLSFSANTIYSLPPLKHFLYVFITFFFFFFSSWLHTQTTAKNVADILVSEWTCGHFDFPLLKRCEEGAEKILFSAFTCYMLKVSGFGISRE